MDPIELELDRRIAVARTRLNKMRELSALEQAVEDLSSEVLMTKAYLKLMMKEIVLLVAVRVKIEPKLIRSPLRGEEPISDARQIVMFLARNRGIGSTSDIGRELGGRDHGTVCHAMKAVASKMATRPEFSQLVTDLTQALDERMKELIIENHHSLHAGSEAGEGAGRAGIELRPTDRPLLSDVPAV